MPFVTTIPLQPFQLALVILLACYIVFAGRPMWALGIYLSMALWTRNVFIGPVVHTWFWLAVIAVATLVYLHRNKLLPDIPARGRWIVPWMVLWWLWIVLLIVVHEVVGARGFYRNLLLTVCLPLPVVLLAARDIRAVRGFAVAFVATTLVGGWFALSMVGITPDYLLRDPLLADSGIIQLGILSYHFFSRGFAISLLLAMALFFEHRARYLNLLFAACAALCVYFLFLIGSRQSLNGALVSAGIFTLWSLRGARLPRGQSVILALALAGMALYIYQANPNLVLRDDETSIADALDVFSSRGSLWEQGWQTVLLSPLWGNGFAYTVLSHNIVIGTLSDQGAVGLVFLAGLVGFSAWLAVGAARIPSDSPYLNWCLVCASIVIFALIHSMASGAVLTVPHLYWATALLWMLSARAGHMAPPGPARALPPARIAPRPRRVLEGLQ